MDKTEILEKIFTKKNKDYTYIILFFLIFSFFVFFAIRPNLLSVFSANSEIKKLRGTNQIYEDQIMKIIDIQSLLEATRKDLPLINETLPYHPQVNKIISDLEKLLNKNKMETLKMNILNIELKDAKKDNNLLKKIGVEMELKGSFNDMRTLIKDIENQRRLKLIKEINIKNSEESSGAAQLNIQLEIESYYL